MGCRISIIESVSRVTSQVIMFHKRVSEKLIGELFWYQKTDSTGFTHCSDPADNPTRVAAIVFLSTLSHQNHLAPLMSEAMSRLLEKPLPPPPSWPTIKASMASLLEPPGVLP